MHEALEDLTFVTCPLSIPASLLTWDGDLQGQLEHQTMKCLEPQGTIPHLTIILSCREERNLEKLISWHMLVNMQMQEKWGFNFQCVFFFIPEPPHGPQYFGLILIHMG